MPVVYFLVGLPATGKSTLARRLAAEGALRLSVDEEMLERFGRIGEDYSIDEHLGLLPMAIDAVRERLCAAVEAGQDVVLDHGLGRRLERDEWKAYVTSLGATWRLFALEAPH